jgi:hypothetical protein
LSLALEKLDICHVCPGTPSNIAAWLKPKNNNPKQTLNGTIPHGIYLYMPQIFVLILVPTVIFGFIAK